MLLSYPVQTLIIINVKVMVLRTSFSSETFFIVLNGVLQSFILIDNMVVSLLNCLLGSFITVMIT